MAQHPLKDGMANHPHSMLPGTQSPDGLPDFASRAGVTMSNGNLRPFHPGANRGDMGENLPGSSDIQTTENSLQNLPLSFLNLLNELQNNGSVPVNLDSPHLRLIVRDSNGLLSIILFFFIILVIISCIGNFVILLLIVKQKLYKENINLCLANIIIVHILQIIIVLPFSLASRLIHNWVLGESMCYLLPIITDLPSHLCILTLFTVNLIRYGKLLFPTHSRPTASLLLPLCWLVSLVLVTPYVLHTSHTSYPGPRLVHGTWYQGGQVCLYQDEDYVQGRMVRGTFLLLLSVPVVTSLFLLCRVWWVLATMEGTRTTSGTETMEQSLDSVSELRPPDNNNDSVMKVTKSGSCGVSLVAQEEDFFIQQEKRTQTFLGACLIIHVFCILPINIFKLILPSLKVSFSTSSIDLSFIILLWISFLPCCSIPPLYLLWSTSNPDPVLILNSINNKKLIAEKEHQRRMSEIRMEDLNRRHSVIRTQSPHEAGQDSPASNRSVGVVVDQEPGADPGDQQMFSKKNSLTVVVQQRRASIISINNQAQGHVQDSSMLDVSNSNHTRSASIRSSHSNKHLQPLTPHIMVEKETLGQDLRKNSNGGRRKSYSNHRKSSFRNKEAPTKSSPMKSRRHSMQPQQNMPRF